MVPETNDVVQNAQESEDEEKKQETLQQAILYWRIANASKRPIAERVNFLVSKFRTK